MLPNKQQPEDPEPIQVEKCLQCIQGYCPICIEDWFKLELDPPYRCDLPFLEKKIDEDPMFYPKQFEDVNRTRANLFDTITDNTLRVISYSEPNGEGGEGDTHYIWSNGYEYKGKMKNGKFNGKGKLYRGRVLIYDGDWADGHIEGYGIDQRFDYETYEGYFKNGKYNGKGKLTWLFETRHMDEYQTGTASYEGDFANGMKHGLGNLYAKWYISFNGLFKMNAPYKGLIQKISDAVFGWKRQWLIRLSIKVN